MPTFWKTDLPQKKAKKKKTYVRKPTGERALFEFVWQSRQHRCEICGAWIPEAKTWCFAHTFAKGVHKKERLNPNNIALVCSMECHAEVDKKRKFREWPAIKL